MADIVTAFTAGKIVKLAFDEFIKSSSGEAAKKLTGEALTQINELRLKIVTWFRDKRNIEAQKAISIIQQQGSPEALNNLTTYLDKEMEVETVFAQDLKQLAQQIVNIQHMNQQQVQSGVTQINHEGAKGTVVQAYKINEMNF